MSQMTSLPPRLRRIKMEQRKLMDQANTLVDLAKVETWTPHHSLPLPCHPNPCHQNPPRHHSHIVYTHVITDHGWFFLHVAPQTQSMMYDLVSDLQRRSEEMDRRMETLEGKLDAILLSLQALPSMLSQAMTQQQADFLDGLLQRVRAASLVSAPLPEQPRPSSVTSEILLHSGSPADIPEIWMDPFNVYLCHFQTVSTLFKVSVRSFGTLISHRKSIIIVHQMALLTFVWRYIDN